MSETTQQDSTPQPPAEVTKPKVTAKKASKKVAKKAAKKAVKKTAKKAAKKATKKVAKKAVKKAAKKATASETSEPSTPKPEKKTEVASSEKPAEQKAEPQSAQATNEQQSEQPQRRNPNSQRKNSDQSEEPSSNNNQRRQRHPKQVQKQHRNGRQKGGGPTKGNQRNNNRNRNNNQRNNQRNNRRDQERTPKKVELTGPIVEVNGLLELAPKGFGFLREPDSSFAQGRTDVFVPPEMTRNHGLRQAVWIHGKAQEGPRGLQLTEISTINGQSPDKSKKLPHFEELKAINPDKRISFETDPDRFSTRVVDIIAPIGRGQRGLIVSPPRSGKTTLMLHMAEAVREKYDEEVHLIVLLIDERPEEVTDFKRSLPGAEIFASSNDDGARSHCRLAELCIERAKRLTEAGEHVFILMDSITRLARAYNAQMGGNKQQKGRGIQSGGIMAGALEEPRRLFAAARNTRNAGSLTIVATALIQTNSRADEAIYQEFKGTGNMELVLDRQIAEQYIYPAVDIYKSGTRREELLLPDISLHKIHMIRRGLAGHRPEQAMERLLFFMKRFHNNAQMLIEIKG